MLGAGMCKVRKKYAHHKACSLFIGELQVGLWVSQQPRPVMIKWANIKNDTVLLLINQNNSYYCSSLRDNGDRNNTHGNKRPKKLRQIWHLMRCEKRERDLASILLGI